MKILITGINSALGILIARKLSENHEIIGLGTRDLGEFKTIKFDLGSNKKFDMEPVDVCLHLAFITDPKLCEKNKDAYKINILGTKKILDYCIKKKIKKLILASTGGVYGFSNHTLKEDTRPNPYNLYSSMKLQAENAAKACSDYFDVVILRYFFPYGPETKKKSLINNLARNITKGKKNLLHNNGKPIVNPIFITDLVEATSVLCTKNTKRFDIFNIAGPDKMSVKNISLLIALLTKKKALFKPSNKMYGDMVADIKKVSKYYKPQIGLKEGLKITINSLK